MTDLVVAASIDNELSVKDFQMVRQLKDLGNQIHLIYYLPKVPADYTVLPSVTEQLHAWHNQGFKILSQIGDRLGIPSENRHFVDEIIGPDRVFQEAKALHAKMILVHKPEELKPRFLTRVLQAVQSMFQGKRPEPKVEQIGRFASSVGIRAGTVTSLDRKREDSKRNYKTKFSQTGHRKSS